MKMNQETTFTYKYSAKQNQEIQEIRKKYLPQEESKFEELKRLDDMVQNSGMAESLCVGIGGAMVFGIGLCFAMKVIGSGMISMAFGIILGIAGICGILAAYPVYRKVYEKTKQNNAPRILELSAELAGEIK